MGTDRGAGEPPARLRIHSTEDRGMRGSDWLGPHPGTLPASRRPSDRMGVVRNGAGLGSRQEREILQKAVRDLKASSEKTFLTISALWPLSGSASFITLCRTVAICGL